MKNFIIFLLITLTSLNATSRCVYLCKSKDAPDGQGKCFYCVPGRDWETCYPECNACWGIECSGGPKSYDNKIEEIFAPDPELLKQEIGYIFANIIRSIANGYNNKMFEKRDFLKGAGKVMDERENEYDFKFEVIEENGVQKWKIFVHDYGTLNFEISLTGNEIIFEYDMKFNDGNAKNNVLYLEMKKEEVEKKYQVYIK